MDGRTASDFAEDLPGNLQSLLDRAKAGTYRAPPVRRVHIPKGPNSSETRPLGIPTFEDKVLQRAVVMVLEPLYEQDFLECSYGFRPGRSAHQALEALWQQTMSLGGGWILDVDTHHWGRSRKGNWVVQRRTAASRFRRAIGRIAEWCRVHRHEPIAVQHTVLSQKLRGHYGYFGITGNSRFLTRFQFVVKGLWRTWLSRRSWAARLGWDAFDRLLKRLPLPPPRAVHSVCRLAGQPMT